MVDYNHFSSTMLLEDQTDHTPSAFMMQRKRACHTALLAFIYLGHPLAIDLGRNIKAWAWVSFSGLRRAIAHRKPGLRLGIGFDVANSLDFLRIEKLCQPSSEISTLNKRRNVSIAVGRTICIFLAVWSHPNK